MLIKNRNGIFWLELIMSDWYKSGMKLKQYLQSTGVTQKAFGDLIGSPQATINRYVNGERFPDRDMIVKIHDATGGQVSVADWYGLADDATERASDGAAA